MNILYSSALTAYVSQRSFRKSLGTPVTLQGTIKLGMVIGLSNLLVNYLETMKYIPSKTDIE